MLIPPGADAPDVVDVLPLEALVPDALLFDAPVLGGPAVSGDPDVELVLLESAPVQAVTSTAIARNAPVAPIAVPVSLDQLFVMITSRL